MNIKERIFKVLKSALNKDHVDETTSQNNTHQWDSLKHLSIIIELETEFNVEFEPEEITKMTDYPNIEKSVNSKI
tara:strand:+ start:1118 stop:1342 length:225 start_codon:yes stop_codon:yes gene_type:complete